MRSKYITAVLITAVLLSGCSNNSAEIAQAKTDACKTVMITDAYGEKYAGFGMKDAIVAFDKLAKLDSKYTEFAVAVHEGNLISNGGWNSPTGKLTETELLEYRKLSAKLSQFCSSS